MIKWGDKVEWLEALFYALCLCMAASFLYRKQIAAAMWVVIAAQNFYRANKVTREHIADIKKMTEELKGLSDMITRSKR